MRHNTAHSAQTTWLPYCVHQVHTQIFWSPCIWSLQTHIILSEFVLLVCICVYFHHDDDLMEVETLWKGYVSDKWLLVLLTVQFVVYHTIPSVVHNMGHVAITVATVNSKQTWYCVCAELLCNICKERGGNSDSKQLYDHVLKLVETGHEGKVCRIMEPISANQQNCS